MPKMDGLELCCYIKNNLDYCHIPIILLTAKTNLQSRIEGLKVGADAYVDKPFSMKFLLVNIANLLKSREQLHIPADTRSAFPVISVQSPVSIQCCWQS